jgi:hypothetical protein
MEITIDLRERKLPIYDKEINMGNVDYQNGYYQDGNYQ